MRTRRFAAALLAALMTATVAAPSTLAAAPGADPAVAVASKASDTALGKRLVTRFFTLLQAQDTAGLDALLSPAFQVARADGSTSTKAAYLAAPPRVESFTLDDFVITRAGGRLVARYSVVTTETINGEELAKDPALRLSVFVRDAATRSWRLLAHSNFNVPVKAS